MLSTYDQAAAPHSVRAGLSGKLKVVRLLLLHHERVSIVYVCCVCL